MILILNGVSSAGKTTLAQEIQEQMPEPWYLMGNDLFFGMLSDKFCRDDWAEAECQALEMLADAAKLFSKSGRSIILDTVYLSVMKRDCFQYLINALVDCPRFLVHVVCPEEELKRRERERGDRDIGQAVWQLSRLVPEEGYDLTVDTYKNTVQQNAVTIIEAIEKRNIYGEKEK